MLETLSTVIIILLLTWFCLWGIVHEEKLIAFEERLSDKLALIIGRAIRRGIKKKKPTKPLTAEEIAMRERLIRLMHENFTEDYSIYLTYSDDSEVRNDV